MALTWTEGYTKTQRLAKDSNADVLVQIKQDWNTGYHMFNARLGRYYSRKQQFADIISGQRYYQTPYDLVHISGISVLVGSTYEPLVRQIRSESEWRELVSYPMGSDWPTDYFPVGNDSFGLWPTPAQTISKGIRLWYQPQDHDLSIDDVTSTTTGALVNVANDPTTGAGTVTAASGNPFSTAMVGLNFQLTGVVDLSWYEIVAASTTVLTLKQSFVGLSMNGAAWRVGQQSIIPQEYADAPMHYALGNYFAAQGNIERSSYHLGTEQKPGVFYDMMRDCEAQYSGATTSSVITDDDYNEISIWAVPPPASMG